MLLGTGTECIHHLGMEKTVSIIMDAGFDGIDVSFSQIKDAQNPFRTDGYRAHCESLLKTVKARGRVFHQAHAPAGGPYKRYMAESVVHFPRVFECCALLGIDLIVVHPVQDGRFYGHEREMLDRSVEFYKDLLPLAKEYGVRIACENMWTMDARGYIVDDTLASPEQFCECIDRVDSEWLVACLDLGHVALCGREPADLIRALGHDRLKALHVHDTDLIHDSHTAPFLGKQDWSSITDALKEIGYTGHFNFEAGYLFKPMPTELYPSALRFLHDTGRYLMGRIAQ